MLITLLAQEKRERCSPLAGFIGRPLRLPQLSKHQSPVSPFAFTVKQIEEALVLNASTLPELQTALNAPEGLKAIPHIQKALHDTAECLKDVVTLPQLTYSLYRAFRTDGRRDPFETPYWLRRERVTAIVLRMLLGDDALRDSLHDYLWAICEETTWIEPPHEGRTLCLSSASTAVTLSETLAFLGDRLHAEVRHRVRQELERRIFEPYLTHEYDLAQSWGVMNWNSVCNSGIGMAFLALEADRGRLALAIHQAMRGLQAYLEQGFASDGSTSEGIGYWHYGMSWFVQFAETLRAKTNGNIDMLSHEKMRDIAAFPARMSLSDRKFATFSDCPANPAFQTGIVARLAERVGEESLGNLCDPEASVNVYDVPGLLRDILWRHNIQTSVLEDDALLPAGGIVRLVSSTPTGCPIVLIAKVGHNGEHHNHNDIGSFILHIDGEDLLTDPGHGAYNRDYFNERRYENPFANSYGHSVPQIGGEGQGTGQEYSGTIRKVITTKKTKRLELDFSNAYPKEKGLLSATRTFSFSTKDAQEILLQDTFRLGSPHISVEEALITWCEVSIDGSSAHILGARHALHLTIQQPVNAVFALKLLEAESRANAREGVLKRLTITANGKRSLEVKVLFTIQLL